jgi:hypothetical protein
MLGKALDKVFRHELGDAPNNIMDKVKPCLWVKCQTSSWGRARWRTQQHNGQSEAIPWPQTLNVMGDRLIWSISQYPHLIVLFKDMVAQRYCGLGFRVPQYHCNFHTNDLISRSFGKKILKKLHDFIFFWWRILFRIFENNNIFWNENFKINFNSLTNVSKLPILLYNNNNVLFSGSFIGYPNCSSVMLCGYQNQMTGTHGY